jgi:RNA polymerase sigma-70 factor, ECF subfamily
MKHEPAHIRELTQMPDEQLLHAFVGGRRDMFPELVRRYEQPLYAFICRVKGRPDGADDAFQETFLRVYRSGANFKGRSSFRTWLYAIAANVCRSEGRKAAVRPRPTPLPEHDPPAREKAPGDVGESGEIAERIAGAVAKLPDDQRTVFVMREYEGMTYAEVAQAVDRPVGTVKSQMRLALQKMRTHLHALAQAHGIA